MEDASRLIKQVIQVLVGSTLVLENSLLVFIIFKTPELHTTKYIFTGSLAVTDTIIGINCVLSLKIDYIEGRTSDKSLFMTIMACAIVGIFLHSLIHMAAIAIERYLYVAHPFFYERSMTHQVIRRIILGIWTFTLCFIVLLFLLQVFVVGEYVNTLRSINKYILVVCLCVCYTSITLVTCLCYILILCQVRKHRKAVGAQEITKEGSSKTKDVIKSIKFFLCMFGFFFFMSTPGIFAEALPDVFNPSVDVRFILIFAAALNSGVNFIILNVFDRFFRQTLKNMLRRWVYQICPCCYKK